MKHLNLYERYSKGMAKTKLFCVETHWYFLVIVHANQSSLQTVGQAFQDRFIWSRINSAPFHILLAIAHNVVIQPSPLPRPILNI